MKTEELGWKENCGLRNTSI